MLPVLLTLVVLIQDSSCRGDAAQHIVTAMRLGAAFDLVRAADAYGAAAEAGCTSARATEIYLRGLLAARAADQQFGDSAALQRVEAAIGRLADHADDPVVRIMQAVLRAAMPAAQHERAELALRIEEMLRLESIQLEAGLPGVPVVTAHEAAGQFWLQLRDWTEATRAFEVAARRIGDTPYVLLGLARAAAGRRDAEACAHYARLIAWWNDRAPAPPEIADAQAYVTQARCAPVAAAPVAPR